MIGKKGWGVYAKSMHYSAGIFASRDPVSMALNSGAHYDPDHSLFLLKSFGRELTVSYPEGRIYFKDTSHSPPFNWCLPLVNYLTRADGTALSGRLISYRELENGHVFYPAFRREAINRISAWLGGKSLDLLAAAVKDLGGEITGGADLGCKLHVFPCFPVVLKLWFPDDEMGGSANILFDSSANHYLHTEDIAVIGELAVYFLMRHYQLLRGCSNEKS